MIDFGSRDTDNLIALVKKFDGKVQLNWCSITLCELSMLINYYIEKEYKPVFMPPTGMTVCPLCGVDSPHQHTPLEQIIYTNGIKRGLSHYKELKDTIAQLEARIKASQAYRADFLFGFNEGSAEEAGYEFVNAQTEEGRKQWWDILRERIYAAPIPEEK